MRFAVLTAVKYRLSSSGFWHLVNSLVDNQRFAETASIFKAELFYDMLIVSSVSAIKFIFPLRLWVWYVHSSCVRDSSQQQKVITC